MDTRSQVPPTSKVATMTPSLAALVRQPADKATEQVKAPPILHDLLGQPGTFIQPKLAIGAPNDKYEQEADRVAEQVMRMPDSKQSTNQSLGLNSLKFDHHVQPKATSEGHKVLTELKSPLEHAGREGKPLPQSVRSFFEPKFGYDFSNVTIHTHAKAGAVAQQMNAQAYTIGSNIVFAPGKFAPASPTGKTLLAHELIHVVQQHQTGIVSPQFKGVTAPGFFANLFRFWDYSSERLNEYLDALRSTDNIIDDHNSDDMARQIAEEWAQNTSAYNLNVRLRVLLIKEMLSGWVLPADQEGILNLLEASGNAELKQIIGTGERQVSYEEIHEAFGRHRERLEYFNHEILSRLDDLKPPPDDSQSLLETLEASEREYGVQLDSVSLSFRWAGGSLYRSFLANINIPKEGSTVRIILYRDRLTISIYPGVEIDIIGPVNTDLTGVEIEFQGLESQLRLSKLSDLANEKVHEYLQIILRGTRFADPTYDFTRDPYLLAEIRDRSVIGDIQRIQYNLQKDDPPESDSHETDEERVDTDAILQSISQVGGDIDFTNLTARRFPDGDGWGVEIPTDTTFRIALDLDNEASELINRDARLERLRISTSGIYIVKDDVRLVSLSGLEMQRGPEFDLQGFQALTDLQPYVLDELPESLRDTAGSIMRGLDFLEDPFGLDRDYQTGTAKAVEGLAEIAMNLASPFLIGYFKQTLMDYSGMRNEQLNEFFYGTDDDYRNE